MPQDYALCRVKDKMSGAHLPHTIREKMRISHCRTTRCQVEPKKINIFLECEYFNDNIHLVAYAFPA